MSIFQIERRHSATFSYPLHSQASIFAFKAQVIEKDATRLIKAEIMKKSQAREHFEAAKDEDRAAVFARKHPKYEKYAPLRHHKTSSVTLSRAIFNSHASG